MSNDEKNPIILSYQRHYLEILFKHRDNGARHNTRKAGISLEVLNFWNEHDSDFKIAVGCDPQVDKDAQFLYEKYGLLRGVAPPSAEAAQFLASDSPEKILTFQKEQGLNGTWGNLDNLRLLYAWAPEHPDPAKGKKLQEAILIMATAENAFGQLMALGEFMGSGNKYNAWFVNGAEHVPSFRSAMIAVTHQDRKWRMQPEYQAEFAEIEKVLTGKRLWNELIPISDSASPAVIRGSEITAVTQLHSAATARATKLIETARELLSPAPLPPIDEHNSDSLKDAVRRINGKTEKDKFARQALVLIGYTNPSIGGFNLARSAGQLGIMESTLAIWEKETDFQAAVTHINNNRQNGSTRIQEWRQIDVYREALENIGLQPKTAPGVEIVGDWSGSPDLMRSFYEKLGTARTVETVAARQALFFLAFEHHAMTAGRPSVAAAEHIIDSAANIASVWRKTGQMADHFRPAFEEVSSGNFDSWKLRPVYAAAIEKLSAFLVEGVKIIREEVEPVSVPSIRVEVPEPAPTYAGSNTHGYIITPNATEIATTRAIHALLKRSPQFVHKIA